MPIDGYWWLLYYWLLVAILLMPIDGYWWLLYNWLLVAIISYITTLDDYYIINYQWIF
jgi:hypothetical protein